MSVLAQQWHSAGSKRGYQDPQSDNEGLDGVGIKSRRLSGGLTAPSARCQPLSDRNAYTVGAHTVAALSALFPSMNDQVITEVLQVCGSDIDAAIKRLGELQLSADTAAGRKATVPLRVTPAKRAASTEAPPATAGVTAAASSAVPGAPEREAAPGSQQQPAGPPPPRQPSSPEEWVEALVQTMSEARDVPDARQRAARALHAFQEAVLAASSAQGSEPSAEVRQQLADLQRDNGILKRAVTIQNTRLQEGAGRDGELQALRLQVKQAAERISALELSNYSLAQHLRAATETQHGFGGPRRHPDVC